MSDGPGDQWNPAAALDPAAGQLAVAFDDRSHSSAAHFDVTLATGIPGAGFGRGRVTSESSHLRDSLWFPARVIGCSRCVSWIGDFMTVAYDRDGTARMVGTDLRRRVSVGGRSGHTENIFYAASS